jgi:dipeptidyl aminopeptidase/acylaminoacyl peptidase
MMFAVRIALGLLAFFIACGHVSAAVLPAPKVPLDYKAYDGWNTILGTVVSDDGRYVAYALVPQDGDPVLIVHDFTTGRDVREARGEMPAFTADGRFVVYVVRAPNVDIHRAKREHKKPDDQPKNGLGILDLSTGTASTVDRVKDFKLAKDAGHDTLAYALESPAAATATSAASAPAASALPSLAPSPSPTPAPMPMPSMAPSPGASASPPDDLHKKDTGTTLVVRDLAAGSETRVSAVTAYALAHDGAFVAYAIESKDGSGDEVRAFGVKGAATFDVMHAPGHYKNLTFAPKHDLLAFVSDAATFSNPAPTYALYQSDLSPAPTPIPSGTPEPMKVDIWNWHDLDLQSTQRKSADMERKRTYAAVVSSAGAAAGATRLATTTVRDIESNENPTIALGLDDVRYRKERSWDTEYADVYAVSLADGSRRLLISKLRDDPSLSPSGGYFVAYDTHARSWYSVDTHDGTRRDLTHRLAPAFYDELDDHPAPPPPYGVAGWLDGGRYVLLRDRYDVWAIDPRTGAAHDLTGGEGRRHHIVFVPQQLDPDADSFDSTKPIVLAATNDDTKDQGIWRVSASGATAFVPQQITMLPKAVTIVARARSAGRVVVAERTFSEVRNLWSTPDLGAAFTRVSDADPQRANYLWGDEHLVSFHSTWGAPLKGILYTPDNFDPHKKYPMLVYFYERFSNYYHEMPFTVPAPNTSPTLVRFVSNGYVVFVPDVAYRVGHPGESALGCILPGVDSIVRRGFVDPTRIGIAGHSWAAYQIAYIITRTNRFRAAEAGAAVANMTSAYGGIRLESGNVRESQYETGQSRIGATPWDRTDLYIENSALFHIRNVNTPYLTIANELDGAVPQSQGIEFFTALRRLGKEAYLFSFDGEDHNLVGREQQKYWTVHLDEFFDHFLRGKPAPDWMTQGVDFLHRGQRDIDGNSFGETY